MITDIVIAPINSIAQHTRNGFCVEIGMNSERQSIPYLRNAFDNLANGALPVAKGTDFKWYGLLGILKADPTDPGLLPSRVKELGLQGFDKVPAEIARHMDYEVAGERYQGDIHILGWVDEPNQAGYWAEVCQPIAEPDRSRWPVD